jgi:hypothetical protein
MNSSGSSIHKWWVSDIDHIPYSTDYAKSQLHYFKMKNDQGKSLSIETLKNSGTNVKRVVALVFAGMAIMLASFFVFTISEPLSSEFWMGLMGFLVLGWLAKVIWTLDSIKFQTGLKLPEFEKKMEQRIEFLEKYLENEGLTEYKEPKVKNGYSMWVFVLIFIVIIIFGMGIMYVKFLK